ASGLYCHLDSERVDDQAFFPRLTALLQQHARKVSTLLKVPDELHDIVVRQRLAAERDFLVAFDVGQPDLQGVQALAEIVEQPNRPAHNWNIASSTGAFAFWAARLTGRRLILIIGHPPAAGRGRRRQLPPARPVLFLRDFSSRPLYPAS